MAVQGPAAADILQTLTSLDLGSLPSYAAAEARIAGIPGLLARTGYTGEDGFELFVAWSDGPAAWDAVQDAGAAHGLRPCGLGARDTLRLEAKMLLYGNDIDDEHTVLEADLGWILKLKKERFIGRDPLLRQQTGGVARKLAGFEMIERGIARHGYPVRVDGAPSGVVTSGTFAPFLKKSIGLAYLPAARSTVGSVFQVEIRDRMVSARVVETPFYKRKK